MRPTRIIVNAFRFDAVLPQRVGRWLMQGLFPTTAINPKEMFAAT